MPELPEVQTVVDTLNRCGIIGCSIDGARIRWAKTVAGESPARFRRRIQGCRILCITRRGKHIVFHLSDGLTLLIHLRMTGRLNWTHRDRALNAHEHVILKIGPRHELRFQDTRKFGRMVLTDAPKAILGKVRPRAIGQRALPAHAFSACFRPENACSNRCCWTRPFWPVWAISTSTKPCGRPASTPAAVPIPWTGKKTDALHRAIRNVLRQGLRNQGTSLGRGQGKLSCGGRPSGAQCGQTQRVPAHRSPLPALLCDHRTHCRGAAQQPHLSGLSESARVIRVTINGIRYRTTTRPKMARPIQTSRFLVNSGGDSEEAALSSGLECPDAFDLFPFFLNLTGAGDFCPFDQMAPTVGPRKRKRCSCLRSVVFLLSISLSLQGPKGGSCERGLGTNF